jgi:glutamyl-tRNA reductase
VAQEELARTIAKLSGINNGDRAQLEELTRRIVNKLLHDPIQVLRETETVHSPMAPYLHAVEKLFKLEGEEKATGEKSLEDKVVDGSGDSGQVE